MTADEVIDTLDQSVDWYRTLAIQQQSATEPSDWLVLAENRQTADQVLKLAFEIARANAAILAKQATAPAAADTDPTSMQTLQQYQAKDAAQHQAVQQEIEAARSDLAGSRASQRANIAAKISELQGELDLLDARTKLLDTMADLLSSNGSGQSSSALKTQIDAMAIALPAANGNGGSGGNAGNGAAAVAGAGASAGATATRPLQPAATAAPESRFGLWDLAAEVIRLWEKDGTISDVDQRTVALQESLGKLRAPLIDAMKGLVARGDALAAAAGSANGAELASMRGGFEALSAQFTQTSTLLVPLSKEDVLLKQYRRNLATWRVNVKNQIHGALQTLGVRLLVLLVILSAVYVAAEAWRRAVFRYIKDARRSHQLLLMRRIVLWSLVIIIVGLAFASELGSVATFAGLITAGVAVAMQSVLVSIVGYFFLIGKYGIRVGDRVQIGDVTGEVIDVGLVRLYLMELGAHGAQGPTGRVVAFANSIVFSVAGGLFKQIPGVNFAWHDMTVALPAGADYGALKERILAAVIHALGDYSAEIARQTQEIRRTTLSAAGDADPRVQLRFSATGVDALIRYPVNLQHAAEIDERVSREVLGVISA
jgi:small-conductance mechanosensitive channel